MSDKIKILNKITLTVFLYLILFQNPLESVSGVFANIDEAICIAMVISAIVKCIITRSINLDSKRINIILCIIFISMLGISGNLIYKYQLLKYAAKDAILMFKGLAVYISVPLLFSNFKVDDYIGVLNIQLKVLSVATFILTVANIIFKFLPSNEVRFGFPTQQLIFSHPTYLASFGILVIALLSVFMKEHKENLKYIVLMAMVVCATGRSKVIAFIAVYMYIFFIIVVKKRKLNRNDFIILIVLGSVFAVGQIISYLNHIYWARSAVTVGSLNVAWDHFPIGTGFGTFGNWVSGENYSPVYYKYGLEVVPGLRPDFYDFIADTFWPMILGQFGIMGLILFFIIVFNIYKGIEGNNDLYNYFGQISLLMYMLILSLAEASFSGPIAVAYLGIIAILGIENKNKHAL